VKPAALRRSGRRQLEEHANVVFGVYAAGDAATAHSRSVANAIGMGSRVANAVALDRVAPDVAAA
jgi:thioredoxin reductase